MEQEQTLNTKPETLNKSQTQNTKRYGLGDRVCLEFRVSDLGFNNAVRNSFLLKLSLFSCLLVVLAAGLATAPAPALAGDVCEDKK